MGIIIEKNVPTPEKISWKSKLDDLAEGESILFHTKDRATVANTVSVNFHKLTEKRFTVAYCKDNKSKCRVWRTK